MTVSRADTLEAKRRTAWWLLTLDAPDAGTDEIAIATWLLYQRLGRMLEREWEKSTGRTISYADFVADEHAP